MPRAERRARVAEALELVGLTARKDDRVSTYSGGMRRRLNLGCALVSGPRLVLLDEPTVAVDPQSRAHIFDAVRDAPRARARPSSTRRTTSRRPRTSATASRSWTRAAWSRCGTLPELLALLARDRGDRAPPRCSRRETVAPLEAVDGVREGRGGRQRGAHLHDPRASRCCRASTARRPSLGQAIVRTRVTPGDARRRVPRADGQGAARLMARSRGRAASRRRSRSSPPGRPAAADSARWRSRAASSSAATTIVRGSGDRKQKLAALSDLLRGFLDTDALARPGRRQAPRRPQRRPRRTSSCELFHEFFVRTYVQRLLLFDAPDFTYGDETVTGDQATVRDGGGHAGRPLRGRLHAPPDRRRLARDRHRGRGREPGARTSAPSSTRRSPRTRSRGCSSACARRWRHPRSGL